MEKPKKLNIKLPETITTADLTEDSKEVLEHFGLDSPHLLNQYSCALEDALIQVLNKQQRALREIARLNAILQEHNIPVSPPPEYKP